MTGASIDELNDSFAIADHVSFASGPGGQPVAEISNEGCSAALCVLGGHVLSYQPAGHEPVLWLSGHSRFEVGHAIRGGIPLCWPWFGPHPTDPDLPVHGFARTSLWTVLDTQALGSDTTQVRLGLSHDELTQAVWPHAFELEVLVTAGPDLRVDLVMRSPERDPYICNAAIHTYFAVADASKITIYGLEGSTYLDKVGDDAVKRQPGPITISEETDRVYCNTTAECVIDDPGLARRIHIQKAGSRSTVVWNPWVAKSKTMPDFGDDEYSGMVCVETANAGEDRATVTMDVEHRLSAIIRVEAVA